VTGTVTGWKDFGAFVDIGSGLRGLVHISELRDEYTDDPSEVVVIGEEVEVMIINIETSPLLKIGLSMKRVGNL
jgi:predicted RNA-binding protein with RPS1 domain